MARGDRGVTCRRCGCLNFNSDREVCDRCRSKASAFHPMTNCQVASANGYVLDTSSETQVHSLGKKRKHHNKTKTTSNKTRKPRPNNIANKKPDVIDLISDDDDDDDDVDEKQMVLDQDRKQGQENDNSLQPSDAEHEKENQSRFQSRVFPVVTFVDSHFPSVNAVATMRKQAAKKKLTVMESSGETLVANVTSTSDQVVVSEPTLAVLGLTQEKAAESTSPPTVESNEVKTLVTTMPERMVENKNFDAVTTNDASESDTPGTFMEEKEAKQDELMLKVSLFQSRVFDSIGFRASDFVTAFDGLAVARRSHPPLSKAITSTGASLTSVAAIVATKPGDYDANDVAEPVKATTVTLSTTESAAPSVATTTTSAAKPTVLLPLESVASKMPASTHAEVMPATSSTTPAKSSTTPAIITLAKLSTTPAITIPANLPLAAPSANVPLLPSKTTVTSAALPPAPAKLPPAVVKAPAQVPAVAPTEVSSLPSQTSSLKVQSLASATNSLSTPAAVKQIPAASAPSAIKATPTRPTTALTAKTAVLAILTPQSTTVARSAATEAFSAPAVHSDSTHVLMPKKEHPEEVRRSDELQRCQKPSPSRVNVTCNADGIFVKVNSVPREIAPVEQPVLGYCSPEFLEFMRECGDDDGDEEGDPDEVSRSQLKLLGVVDLTNLSESEDSGVGSPSSTPRVKRPKGEVQQHTLLPNEQARIEGQSIVYTTANVSGKGTWHVPTLDSERKRTHAERIMCELCEEKVISSRLIRCPTCMKYYHKKCARENGNEDICWNCELGSMIDDSELDEEHAKHNSEYLAYLKALRSSLEDGEVDEEEIVADNENQEGNQCLAEEDAETASSTVGKEDSHPLPEESSAKAAGKRWKEFIGDATADIDASYVEVTKRIAEELCDDEKRRLYSRGFVSREEFEAQMTEVEDYYIKEEARLQQLEREKALEAKKVAEARKVQVEAEQTIIAEQSAGSSTMADSTIADSTIADSTATVHGCASAASVLTDQTSPFTPTTVIAPAVIALKNPATAPTAPMAAPVMPLSRLQPANKPFAARTPIPAPSVPSTSLAAAFRAKLESTPAAGSQPPSLHNTHNLSFYSG